MAETIKPEHERVKEGSRHLRGTIKEECASKETHFSKDSISLLKFHGTYQQDDRDVRNTRRKQGLKPLYTLMVRSKIPGGRLSAKQYLVHDELADRYGNGTLRITTRQGFQFHGVLKGNLKAVIAGINKELGTTLGACGDIVRNTLGCPAPSSDRIQSQVYEYAKAISDAFLPKTRAYHEIWLNGEQLSAPETEQEPIYGEGYLPRKFKIAIAFPEDNCVDVYTNDIGIVPEVKSGKLAGFNILVGGGLGMSHGSKETFPRLADPLCFVAPAELLEITKAIVLVQRDFGDRKSRKHARMKYLIHDRGLDWFGGEVEKRFGKKLSPPHVIHWKGFENHLGWHEQGGGLWYFGISVENGRIKDEGPLKMKFGLKAIVKRFMTPVYLTATQDVLISDLKENEKQEFEKFLSSYGIPLPSALSSIEKHAMACPALPTCGLAITESERILPAMIDELEAALKSLGLQNEKITLRMTGCPNGCARPYSSEIGLVGRAVGTYNIYLGGCLDGTRLNEIYLEQVPEAEMVKKLISVFKLFQKERQAGEQFGNFCHRFGVLKLRELAEGKT